MYIRYLQCFSCTERYPRSKLKYRCDCGGSLDIVYDYSKLKKQLSWKKLLSRPFNHWRYKEFYPTVKNEITLGEGGTPLIESSKNLYFKLESQNPTGSFKDRGSTIELSHAKDFHAKQIVCASTGNMGASVAAYSARAGIPCEIILPESATGEKIQQIKNYHAKVTRTKGDYSIAAEKAYQKFKKLHHFLVGDYAFRGEGEKSVGYEIIDQMKNEHKSSPDYLFVPMGNGTLISGIWKGMKEMRLAGLLNKLPKLVGCQVKGCNVIVKSFETGNAIKKVIPKTIAGAVACGDPLDGAKAVAALRESKGLGVEVSDTELLKARRELGQQGIDGEPSGVLSYAGYKKLNVRGKSVIIISGHGLKDLTQV